MSGTWCSVEFNKAIVMGYGISNTNAGFNYRVIAGLMKTYVEFFLKAKTCNGGVKNAVECDGLNKSHTALGLDIHISPGETSKKQVCNK